MALKSILCIRLKDKYFSFKKAIIFLETLKRLSKFDENGLGDAMERIEEFSERLKELLLLENESVKTLSENISVTGSSLYGYLSEDHFPTLENALKIADYFDCSLDYLFGFTDKKEKHNFSFEKTLPERLEQAIFESGKSKYRIAKAYDFSESQLYRWCHGKSQPSLANLVKLADALDCSLDFLAR